MDENSNEPKIDYFPDGWGMALPEDNNLTPEEALEYAKKIDEQKRGKREQA